MRALKAKASVLVAVAWREPNRALRRRVSALVAAVWREPMRALRRAIRHRYDELVLGRSGLFDAAWYARKHPEVAASGMDPLAHFVRVGAAQGLDPNPWFDTSWYRDRNPRATRRYRNPVVHYLRHADRDPHPDFSTSAYLASHPEVARARKNPLLHFLRSWVSEADEEFLEARGMVSTGVMNGAWYGATPIERAPLGAPVTSLPEVIAARIHRADTDALLRYVDPMGARDGGAPPPLTRSLAPLAHLERRIRASRPRGEARGAASLSFTVLTPFYRHDAHFAACARSVLALAERSEGFPLEWIVLNDDPAFTAAELERSIPAELLGRARILSDGRNRGIVARLDEGVRAARHEWILFVDCDDLVAPDAGRVLAHYVERFPRCRYVSSAMIDVTEDGEVLRFRRRTASPVSLLAEGMTAGHLKAVRRDAFEDHGLFDPAFEGCQDYDLALRMALEEPILYAPEYLYSYRWHRGSQSVAHAVRQARTADAVVRKHSLRLLAEGAPPVGAPAPEALPERGVAIVRTQGRRNDLLLEALHSLTVQAVPVSALVVVHGGSEALAGVRAAAEGLPGVELLHAPDTRRRRGHPLNVALRHVLEAPVPAGFVCFLDDDDVLYPLFALEMHEALRATGADLVHAASNRRVPWTAARKGYAPLPAPCLLVRNFVPINAYAVRVEALRRASLSFDEDLEVNEDWDFLVQALGAGLRFHAIEDVVSEFRITGDGNVEMSRKRDARLWDECLARIRPRQARAAQAIGRRRLLEQLLEFPAHLLEALDDDERKLVLATRAFVDEHCPAPGAERTRAREA